MSSLLRDAQPNDAARIAEIYNHAVTQTTALLMDTTVDAVDRAKWIVERQGMGLPVIVSVDQDDAATGYASYGPWRPHDGFRHTVENSVYVHPDHQGTGLGRALLASLIERAQEQRLHVMIAAIEARNTGSIRLHEQFGFHANPPLPEVGTKFGRWLDLVFMVKKLENDDPR